MQRRDVLWDCVLLQAVGGTGVEHNTQTGEEASGARAGHAAGDTCSISKANDTNVSACTM